MVIVARIAQFPSVKKNHSFVCVVWNCYTLLNIGIYTSIDARREVRSHGAMHHLDGSHIF